MQTSPKPNQGALSKLSGMTFKTMYAFSSAVAASNAGVPAEVIRTGF